MSKATVATFQLHTALQEKIRDLSAERGRGGACHSGQREGDGRVAEEDQGRVWRRFLVWGQSVGSWTWGLGQG